MDLLTVWAPAAERVELALGDDRRVMEPTNGGWFAAPRPAPGTDYAFVVDGNGPFPDPRSRHQPEGPHGPSRIVDPDAFTWTDATFRAPPLASGLIYELHIGTFTPEGTFDAAIGRLDHLVELGVTHVEILPVHAWGGRWGWGYDGVCLYAPYEPYGGPDGLRRFVDACHARDLAVLVDAVYNHLGPDGNYTSQFGPYFTDDHHTPWGAGLNVDRAGSDEVRRWILDNARMWFTEYHADGLRLDAIHAIADASAVHLLEEMATETAELADQLRRPLVLVAESNLNDHRLVRPRHLGGHGLDAMWSDDFHHTVHVALTGERAGYYEDFGRPPGPLSELARTVERGFVYDGGYSPHRDRRHGRPMGDTPPTTLVVSIQNHDQVGNRAAGERLADLVGVDRAMVAAALMLCGPSVPMLFQGEEWAASSPFRFFTDHRDPALGDAVREGRRGEFAAFGWAPEDVPDPQDPDTFECSKLRWDELTGGDHARVLDWYRRLVRLRRDAALGDGRWAQARADDDAGTIVIDRGEVVVAANISTQEQLVPIAGLDGDVELLASRDGALITDGAIRLPSNAAAVVRRSRTNDPRGPRGGGRTRA
ncbi:MAG: malto-oligosyltrehalose trehalohydrolase [Actinomycetota bacterium]|nr:malto-oligosyltrehalose trehalohydrolase [Actinomycetota bacterium]